ncbi:hypothetical protein [Pontimicrobium sp. SW4]|uniref:Lipoprotein n=1 Tax=Pontimicrobium sp. SW4 TaxID=3153519 RepID=A0AAU7BPG3_9FLAO
MKTVSKLIAIIFLLGFVACKDTKKEEEETLAAIDEIETIEGEMEEIAEDIENGVKDLEEAIKELEEDIKEIVN